MAHISIPHAFEELRITVANTHGIKSKRAHAAALSLSSKTDAAFADLIAARAGHETGRFLCRQPLQCSRIKIVVPCAAVAQRADIKSTNSLRCTANLIGHSKSPLSLQKDSCRFQAMICFHTLLKTSSMASRRFSTHADNTDFPIPQKRYRQ